MGPYQRMLLVLAALIFSLGVFMIGLGSRYKWCGGEDFGRDGTYYPPRVLDSWTGTTKSL